MGIEGNRDRADFSEEGEILDAEGEQKEKRIDERSLEEVVEAAFAAELDSPLRQNAEVLLKNVMEFYAGYEDHKTWRNTAYALTAAALALLSYLHGAPLLDSELDIAGFWYFAAAILVIATLIVDALTAMDAPKYKRNFNDTRIQAKSIGLKLKNRDLNTFINLMYEENELRSMGTTQRGPWTVWKEDASQIFTQVVTTVEEAQTFFDSSALVQQETPAKRIEDMLANLEDDSEDEDDDFDDDRKKEMKNRNRKIKKDRD